jgi:hypothetical protein
VAHVGGRGDAGGKAVQVGEPAGIFELAGQLERIVHRQHVGRSVLPHQLRDVLPDQAVVMPVEVVVTDDVGDVFPRAVVEEHPPDDGLLRFDRMRRQAQARELLVHVRLARLPRLRR